MPRTRVSVAGTATAQDAGFTMIELMVTLAIIGILFAISVWGMLAYARAQEEATTSSGLTATLRDASERAQSEDLTYCVALDAATPTTATQWVTWRFSCDPNDPTTPGVKVQTGHASGTSVVGIATSVVTPNSAGFSDGCPSSDLACLYFYPRGVSSSGALSVTRPGNTSTYTVNVVGLTGRVYVQH